MKAARLHQRGGAEQIVYEDAPMPSPAQSDALVRVYATGITPAELSWDPTYSNPDGSSRIPIIPGHEVSGVVESLGAGVSGLQVGDPVYGLTDFYRDGAAAQYVAVHADDLAPKPQTIDHAHAAAVPLSGLTVWQALFDHADLSRGQRLLIHGAAGGVGTFTVQLARWRGIHVIATGSQHNADFLRQLGADEFLDYNAVRFEEQVRDVDAVLDTVGGDTLQRSWRTLRPGGILISIVEPIPEGEPARHNARGKFFIVEPDRAELIEITRLIDTHVLAPTVAKVVPLESAREAFAEGSGGHTRGKIVIQVRTE